MALNLKNLAEELKKKLQQGGQTVKNVYSGYANNPTVKNAGNWQTKNIVDPFFDKITNIPRYQLPQNFIPKANTKVPAVNNLLNLGREIARGAIESPLNIPRNLVVGKARLERENFNMAMGRGFNFQNALAGVGNLGEAALDIGTLGVGKSIAKEGAKQVAKTGVKQAIKQGMVSGAGYGALGGLSYGLGNQYNKKFDLGEVSQGTLGGALVGGTLGGVSSGAGALFGKIFGLVKKNNPKLSDEAATKIAKTYIRDRAGKFAKQAVGIEPRFPSDIENVSKQMTKVSDTKFVPKEYAGLYKKIDLSLGTPTDIRDMPVGLSIKKLTKAEHDLNVGKGIKSKYQQSIPTIKTKERKFSKTVMASDRTAPDVKNIFDKQYYSPITNKQTISEADSIIKSNLDEAINIAKNGESTALNNAVSMRLVEKFQKEGNFAQASDLLETLTRKPTSQGQAIQILSYWSKLSPTGAVKYAQTLKNRASGGGSGAFESIGEVATKRITDLANQVQKLPEGRNKTLKTAELVEAIHSVVPPSLLSKISSIQAMAQLLNPKTAIRNIVGNLGFVGGENIARIASVPLDMATSLVTGKRSITAPKLGVQAKGFGLGLVEGVQEALKGVNTSQLGSQFDLPRAKTFNDPVFGTLEKALNLELKAPDRAFYRAAFDESLASQMQINKVIEPTPDMIQQAHFDGLYRTFQDENVASTLFTGIKRALNLGKDFGLGDIVLKYPKTPANLIARGVDYSPAGFVNTVFQMAKPLFGKQFDQKAFVESFGRALTGSAGLITTGVILNKLGIITGSPEKDKDISATQRSLGIGQYRINVSALKRFVLSGMDPTESKPKEGDKLVSYDWFQPFAIGISMGANISENNGKVSNKGQVATILDSLQGGVETLAEQPLVSGLKKLFSGDPSSFVSSIVSSVKGTPSSFVPTLLSQINQSQDNFSRSTYDPSMITESINMAKAKIPFVSQSLPIRYDVWGQPMERFQDGSNSAFNVFLNPAFVSTLKSTPEGNEVINIFERSGETQQAPRVVPKSVKINGQNMELSAEQQGVYQEYVGTKTQQLFNNLVQDKSFQDMTDEEKAKKMAQLLTDINTAAKIELFGNNPKTVSKQARAILAGGMGSTKLSNTNSIVSSIVKGKSKKLKKLTFKVSKFKPTKITIKKRQAPKVATIKFKKPKKTKIVRRYTIKA